MSEKRRIVTQNSQNKSRLRVSKAKRPKRMKSKPIRYGTRISASDRDAFFERVSSNTDSDDTTDGYVQTSDTINLIEHSESGSNASSLSSDEIVSIRDDTNSLTAPPESIGFQTPLDETSVELTSPLESDERHVPIEEICACGRHSTPSESNDHVILAKLDEILKRISCIEKSTAKMEVRLRNLESVSRIDIDIGQRASYSEDDFIQLGLPVKNQGSLDKLEEDLNSEDFRRRMVIYLARIEYFLKFGT